MTDNSKPRITLEFALDTSVVRPDPVNFVVRTCRPNDLRSLAGLMCASYAGTAPVRTFENALTEVQRFASGHYGPPLWGCTLVARRDETPVSAVLACEEASAMLLSYVFTRPEWRNRGLATTLTHFAMSSAKDAGYATARLTVRTSNAPAMHLYDKLGFRRV